MRSTRTLKLLWILSLTCGMVLAQSAPQTAPPPNRNISGPPPQSHTPSTPRQSPPPGALAPQPVRQLTGNGTIEGFVYWDTTSLSHVPAGSCTGLSVTVAVESSSGGRFAPLATTTNNFKYIGQVKQFLTGGKVKAYDVCTYGYDKVPVGANLKVSIIATRDAFSPPGAPQGFSGPINIINAQCNMLPRIVNPTASDLFSHWGTCQNMAFDMNFEVTPVLTALGSSEGSGSQSPAANVQMGTNPASAGALLQSGGQSQLLNGRKVELNPQPLPPKQVGTLMSTPNSDSAATSRPQTGMLTSTQSGGAGKSVGVVPSTKIRPAQPPAKPGASPAALHTIKSPFHMTNFDPRIHGFRFVNDFLNDVVPSMDVRTGGLCGGMSYSALDYYFAHVPIPQQTYRPANRTTLQSYLYTREVESLTGNLDKWAEVGFNPGGARNGEFFNWGLQGTNGGRLEELRSFIDQGIPAVLDLQADSGTGNHQIVAIGYDMGRYSGDLGAFQGDLKITVYDPNYPMKTRTLIPDVPNQVYRYAEGGTERWRTYFVDKNYHAKTPPNLPNPVYPNDGTARELILTFHTGSDDLRGGNDNINLTIDLLDGSQQAYPNINLSARWLPNYPENARVILSKPVRPDQIRDLVITDTFGGGFDGDNWDMGSVSVNLLVNGKIASVTTAGFHRFSADSSGPKSKTLTIALQ